MGLAGFLLELKLGCLGVLGFRGCSGQVNAFISD